MRCANPDSLVILLDPGGEVFRQARAADLAGAIASHLRLPALRGHRRTHPLARGPGAVDRRLRRDRRGAARRSSSSMPSSACCRAPSTTRPRIEESFGHGSARVPAVHPPARVPWHGGAGHPDVRRSRCGRPLAARRRPSSGRAACARTSSTTRTGRPAESRGRAILRRRRTRPRRSRISPLQPRLPR